MIHVHIGSTFEIIIAINKYVRNKRKYEKMLAEWRCLNMDSNMSSEVYNAVLIRA
jgi:hypothetical protein